MTDSSRLSPGNSRKVEHLMGIFLAAGYLSLLLATADGIGFARDEGFYFKAAASYQGWFDLLSESPSLAMTKESIDKHWRYNHEHPALMKSLFGFSHRLFHEKLGCMLDSTSYRFPGMVSGAFIVYLLFIWGSAIYGRPAGLFAALAFAMMPRAFYHAHLNCFDVPITAAWVLVCYLYWRSLSSGYFGLGAGAAFGLALCIKLNAFFLPFVLGIHFALMLFYDRKLSKGHEKIRLKPWAFVWGTALAPPIFLAHWPWLWFDTWKHLMTYLGFHTHHAHYNTAWLGQNIYEAPTPVFLPLGMTLITVPSTTILLSFIGALLLLRRHFPAGLVEKVARFWSSRQTAPAQGLDLLLIMNAVFPILLISLPNVPIFGGTKHWMPAMPFWALLAGAAVSRILDIIPMYVNSRIYRALISVSVFVLLIAPSFQQTATSHPHGLASYVPLAGGVPGAADMGMTRQFWGYTTMGVLPFLNDRVPKNGKVYFHDTAGPSVRKFKEDGFLRKDIRSSRLGESDYALNHHELHMIVFEAYIWDFYGTVVPSYVLSHHGVPLVSVYKKR